MSDRLTSFVEVARRTGLFDPRRVPALTAATARWGPTIAAPSAASALSSPDKAAVIDDRGVVTCAELHRMSSDLAKGFVGIGLKRGDRLGIVCRNHRGFVEASIAAAKAGLCVVYLNTSFAAPQMAEVVQRERVAALLIDHSLLRLIDPDSCPVPVIVATQVDGDAHGDLPARTRSLDDVRSTRGPRLPLRASMPVAPILLTSGTTGTPKGAERSNRADPSGAASFIERIPYRHDDVVAITSPLFHAWGLAQLFLASALGATAALTTTFAAEATLEQIERERVTVLAVVPAILQRLLASPALESTDLSSLRIVASSGSALPVPVVEEWFDRVGANLYNLYGSTEVGQATLATPVDLASDPATAGRPLAGSTIAILDATGVEVEPTTVGRIFVGNGAQFDGYTGGGGKEIIDGLMASGDVGYVDDDGLLFVTGRADDMILSGGENVFPQEIEDLLLSHPKIADVAIVAVDDEDFGQRLAAYVVKAPDARLSATAVKTWVADHLARHKTPRDVHFVDEIPRTLTGKIRRNQLR